MNERELCGVTGNAGEAGDSRISRCPRCGKAFGCGMAAGASSCWCAGLPVLRVSKEEAARCYCPECLRELLDKQETR